MMNNDKLGIFNLNIIKKYDTESVLKYNDFTINNGLMLTYSQAIELIDTRNLELNKSGRIEFGEGIIGKLIYAFYDSPYITNTNYHETLNDLLEIFYYYKNETLERLSDDELIKIMSNLFNGVCHGSIELLATKELEKLARDIRGNN